MNTVGEQFWQERKAKKISLAKASRDLLIKKEHLEAIEAGDWQNLPEPTIYKGFIKNYAQYLNLDTSKILALYRREYDETKYPHKKSPLQVKKRLMITPNKFAVILLIVATAIFAINVANFGIDSGILKFASNKINSDAYLTLAFKSYIILGIVTAAVGFLISPLLAKVIGFEQITNLLRIAFTSTIFLLLTNFYVALLQSKQEFVKASLINISSNLSKIIILIIAAAFF